MYDAKTMPVTKAMPGQSENPLVKRAGSHSDAPEEGLEVFGGGAQRRNL